MGGGEAGVFLKEFIHAYVRGGVIGGEIKGQRGREF